MNAGTLARWNTAEAQHAAAMILPCCGSQMWASAMAAARPVHDLPDLLTRSVQIWQALPAAAWQEAFASHPRIGEDPAITTAERSAAWSRQEQSTAQSDLETAHALAAANAAYEARFGRIFLICASGRSADQILAEAERRMQNDAATELLEAVHQQQQITALRLKRWLTEGA